MAEKNGGKPLARVPATLPGFFGGGHRAKPIQDTTIAAAVNKKMIGFGFYEQLLMFTWRRRN
jgi:hypothetical protein